MSWFSDGLDFLGRQFGSSSSLGSSAGDSITKGLGLVDDSGGTDWSKIDKYIDGGRKLWNLFDSNNARQGVRSDMLNQYQQIDAANQKHAQEMAAYQQQQAAGAAAARRANDAKARKAQGKALKVQEKFLSQMISNYQPYADAAKTLTPEMAKNYKQYLDTTSLLSQYLAPSVMKNLGSAPTPAATPQLTPQAYAAPSKAAPISFPTLEEMLKRGG